MTAFTRLPMPETLEEFHDLLEALSTAAHRLGYIKGCDHTARSILRRNSDLKLPEFKEIKKLRAQWDAEVAEGRAIDSTKPPKPKRRRWSANGAPA